jgi:hypothetical protein
MVQTIALMHPFYGGEAVYWARGVQKSYREDSYSTMRKGLQSETDVIKSMPQFLIIPNPANQTISICSSDKNTVIIACELFDITGKLLLDVRGETNSSLNQIDVSSLVNGNYLIKIYTLNSNPSFNKLTIIR